MRQQNLTEGGVIAETVHTWTGLQHFTKNPKNQIISEIRDVWGKLSSTIDANSKTTTFAFDAFGNLAKTTDPHGNLVEVVYDDWGRRIKLIDPDLGTINYGVDPLGLVWQQIRPMERLAGQSTEMMYDEIGRMTSRISSDSTATWTYDVLLGQPGACATTRSCGKLVQAATLAGSAELDYRQEFTFDALGRPDTTTRYLDVAYASKLSYDAWGRLSREEFKRGNGAAKSYDRRYNAWGQLERIERNGAALWTAIGLDAAGQVTNATLANGLLLASTFDPYTGRLKDGTVNAAAGQRLHEAYQYDVLGNVSQRTQEWGATSFIENFDYDGLNRLKSSTIVGYPQQSFTYDDIGNLKNKTGVGSGSYSYPVAGARRPHAVSNIPGIGDFVYDDNGNLLSGAGRTVSWTSFDMPLTISKGGVSSTFYYGADRERVKQVRSDNVTVWYAGAMEVEASGGAVTVKTYLPNGLGVEIERNGASKLYFQHRDRLGSVMALSDETGTLSEQLAYDAWGKRRTQATPNTPDSIDGQLDNKGFTGHEMLDGLDLVHMNGRVYDPLIARFMSADVIIQEPEHSQSYNRYTYVWNNPTNLTDPTGFQAQAPNSVAQIICEQSAGCQIKDGKIVQTAPIPEPSNENSPGAGAANKQDQQKGTSRSANTNNAGQAGKPKEGDHDYSVWTKLKEKCDANCIKDWQKGSRLFSYPSEGLKPSPADLSGRPQVVYGTLPFEDANDPTNYTTPGGRVVQSEGPNGTVTNTTLKDHVFCCGQISRTLMITKDNTLYMYTRGVGYNVYMGTEIRSDALAKFNSFAGEKIFRALDQQLIKFMNEEKK